MDDLVNEYGISKEPVEEFVKRNHYEAKIKYPQFLPTGHDVWKNPNIPFLPIDWEKELDWETMYEEAKKLHKHYVPHRHHENHSGWSSLCIHGMSSIHTEAPHAYGYTNQNAPWRWTDIADYCPTITNFFKNDFDYKRYYRIRIMKLSPGGWIIPHRDTTDIKDAHIGPVNFALNNPDNCKFYMDNIGWLPWRPGRMVKLNLYNVHSVFNHSNEDRYHIIIHGEAGNSWSQRIFQNYQHWKRIYA